jgi:2'-5' RNA ligase
VDIVTVSQRQVQNRRRYEKILRTPYLAMHIELSASLGGKLCKIGERLRRVDSHQVYSLRSRLHVTVKELGWLGEDVERHDLPKVTSIMRDVVSAQRPFDLSVKGIGVFPTVIFGRIDKGRDEIRRLNTELVKRLDDRVARGEYDGADMEPHVTMAHFASRNVERLLGEVRRLETRSVGEMRVREVLVVKYLAHKLFEMPTRETLETLRLG